MNLDAEAILKNAISDGVRESIKNKLTSSYSDSPLNKLIAEAIAQHGPELRAMIGDALEKQINSLKSDPATRARITLAIEDIVRQKTV